MVGEFTIPKFALDLQDFPYPWTGLFDLANGLAEDGCILPGETLIDQLHALNLKDGLTKFYSASCHKCHRYPGFLYDTYDTCGDGKTKAVGACLFP